MTTLTADLEYFKCDLCGIFFHKDIYCDHRRQCKGRDNPELKKREVEVIAGQIDASDRRALLESGALHCVGDRVPLDRKSQLEASRARTKLHEEYVLQKEQEEAAKPKKSNAELLAFLEE